MTPCTLCGLEAGRNPLSHRFDGQDRTFCCMGCMNVYAILLESGVVQSGSDFRDTDLYRESLKLGLIANGRVQPAFEIPTDAEVREGVFHISGMWCSSCAWIIEQAVAAEPGVRSAEVLFASDLLKVRYCPQYLPPSRIPERVRSLGYNAQEYSAQTRRDDSERRSLLLRLGVAFFLWMNVMVLSLVVYASYWESISDSARAIVPWALMALTTPAITYSAWPIMRGAAFGIRNRTLRMESLLAIGIIAAYLYSTVQAIQGGKHFYFDTACAIITLVLAGKVLERGAKEKTAQSMAWLYRMMPKKARLLENTRERFVSVEALQPGMTFLVKAGEAIPSDGVVSSGESHIDESVLTGESTPRRRGTGDEVVGGSINIEGVLAVRATRTGEDTTLSQVIRAVESAMSSRSEIERIVDRVSRVFVPVVTGIAALTFGVGIWAGLDTATALMRAIAVLVIACPCALGMATPLAITTAVAACSRHGILVSDSRVLELAGKVDAVLFDKTGTVTQGDFTVVDMVLAPALVAAGEVARQSDDALALVAALETYSEHPLGRAAVDYANALGIVPAPASGITIVKGMGITGHVGDCEIFVGNRRMVSESGAELDSETASRAAGWELQGRTVAFFGWDRAVAGAIALGDRLRPEAVGVIADLQKRGIRTALISGDSLATTACVAAELGITDFRAEVMPADKMAVIHDYQRRGSKVAMVGDGVNDAPALAAADLGIALGSGAALAMQAAPVVLMTSDLGRVNAVFESAAETLRIVRQNLFWAFFYNLIGISLAVVGVLNPILAAGAMALSSLSVIGNSLRLSRRRS